MPATVIITDRKFYYELKNGATFATNLGVYSMNLIGSVMEKVKLVQTVRCDWFSASLNGDQFNFIAAGQCQRTYGSFIADGFAIGDTFDYLDAFAGTIIMKGTITGLTADGLNLFYTPTGGYADQAPNVTQNTYIRGTTVLKSLQYSFGIIENSEAVNYLSKATGQEQSYAFKDVTASTAGVPMNGVNNWETGSITCSVGVVTGLYYQTFTITHYFTNPYFKPGYELEYGVSIPSEFANTNSPKYVSKCEFRVLYTDPNGAKIGIDDSNLGDVAFFNESMIGAVSPYTFYAIQYTDASANTIAGIQAVGKTHVVIIVNGTFTATHKHGVYISKGNGQSLLNLSTSFNDLFLYDHIAGASVDAAPANSTIITAYSCVKDVSNSFVTFTFDVEYSSPQAATIAATDSFLIAVQLTQDNLATNVSDKVTLLDSDMYGLFILDPDTPGLLRWRDNRFYNHLQVFPDDTHDLSLSQHDFKGWLEDGVLNNLLFDLDLSKFANLAGLTGQFIAYNTVTLEYFVINSYTFNTALGIVAPLGAFNNVSQYNLQYSRGYNLLIGDQFNMLRLKSDAFPVGNFLTYDCLIPWKIDWQDWIKNANVNAAFFDLTQLNNGLNNKSPRFSTGDWQLRFLYTATVTDLTTSTNYEFLSPKIYINDYDVDGNTPPRWVATKSTWDETGTQNLDGRILTNAKTLFRTVWTWDISYGNPLSNTYVDFVGIHRIEVFQALTSMNIEEFSSVRKNLNVLLKPVSGSTKLKVTIGATTVTTECLIAKLSKGQSYKLSARLFALGSAYGETWEEINIVWDLISSQWQFM